MTRHELLDHFAGIALAELIKSDEEIQIALDVTGKTEKEIQQEHKKAWAAMREETAKEAYSYAMMMMRNRDAAHEWLNKQTKE